MPALISSTNQSLERVARLDGAAADDQGIGVEGVHHLVEEEAERVSLDAEDVAAHRIAAFGEARTFLAACCGSSVASW